MLNQLQNETFVDLGLALCDAKMAYCVDGPTRREIVDRAKALLLAAPKDTPICVATDDRSLVASALLSACCGGPPIVLCHALSLEAIADARSAIPFSQVLCASDQEIPNDVARLHDLPCENTCVDLQPDRNSQRPVVILFTGGSTGRARYWSKTAGNLWSEVQVLARQFQVSSEDRILPTVPPYHIYGLLFSVLLPLFSGAVVDRFAPYFPREVMARAKDIRATILVSVPSHYRLLSSLKMEKDCIRLAISSSARLETSDAHTFFHNTGIVPTEVFGSTETGGVALRQQVPGQSCPWTALPGVTWDIDDEALLVKSPFLSPELPRDTSGLYRTADRAKRDSDTHFVVLGRADGVVKIGGLRIDLVEIEEKVRRIDGVRDAMVFARGKDDSRGTEIVAVVETPLSEQALRAQMLCTLPSVAVPRVIRCVSRLPTSPTGKRERQAALQLLEPYCVVEDHGNTTAS